MSRELSRGRGPENCEDIVKREVRRILGDDVNTLYMCQEDIKTLRSQRREVAIKAVN